MNAYHEILAYYVELAREHNDPLLPKYLRVEAYQRGRACIELAKRLGLNVGSLIIDADMAVMEETGGPNGFPICAGFRLDMS